MVTSKVIPGMTRKIPIFTVLGATLIMIGFAAGRYSQTSLIAPISLMPLAKPDPAPQDPTLPNSQFFVSRAIDGDTIELENGDKVRYIGIDTPETLDPRKPVQCFGKNATAKNKELVEEKPVWLVKDVTNKDKYGRLLRYVYLGDPDQESSMFVNLELVKQGFAHSSTYPPDIKYQDLFAAAEKEAREASRGLWGKCSRSTKKFEATSKEHRLTPPSRCTISSSAFGLAKSLARNPPS